MLRIVFCVELTVPAAVASVETISVDVTQNLCAGSMPQYSFVECLRVVDPCHVLSTTSVRLVQPIVLDSTYLKTRQKTRQK